MAIVAGKMLVRRAKAGEPGRRWEKISATESADGRRMMVFGRGLDLIERFPIDDWRRIEGGCLVCWAGYCWELLEE